MFYLTRPALPLAKDARVKALANHQAIQKILTAAGYGLSEENNLDATAFVRSISGVILVKGWYENYQIYHKVQLAAILHKKFYWYEQGASSLVLLSNEHLRKAMAVGREVSGNYIDGILL